MLAAELVAKSAIATAAKKRASPIVVALPVSIKQDFTVNCVIFFSLSLSASNHSQPTAVEAAFSRLGPIMHQAARMLAHIFAQPAESPPAARKEKRSSALLFSLDISHFYT